MLKQGFNTWTLAHFYYVASGTYCCVFIMLLQVRIAVFLLRCFEFKYPGTIAKNECSIVLEICPTPNPTLNLPDSVDKCKTDIKMHLLMQPCHLNFLICRFELFCQTEPHFSSTSTYSVIYRTTYHLWKPIDMKLDMCDANIQKHHFSNLPAY